jgi:biotin transport system substrate-specific component
MNSLADAMNRVATAAADLSVPRSLRRPLAIVLGSLLVAVCAPVTLQTFAVLLLGLLLSPAVSAAALVLYLLEGAIGLPVFSPYAPPGFLHLLGPTGGYLLSYPFAAALTGLLRSRFASRGFAPSLLAAATGSLFILLCGAAWFGILTHQSAGAVLTLAILPFVAGDVLKVVAAAGVVSGIGRFRRR